MVRYKKYLDLEIFEGEISMHAYPWHFHEGYTFILVEKGSITYEFQNERLILEGAEAFIIEPFKVHRNIISRTTIYKAIFIPPEYFAKVERGKIGTLKWKDTKVIHSLDHLYHKIEQEGNKNELEQIIFRIGELINNPNSDKISDWSDSFHSVPKLNMDSSIKKLAAEAHVSIFHFQRKFKKNYGLTIGQLKQQEKTIAAKALLEKGRSSPDVAYELGFFDQSHFIKYFKKMWATTPKNFQ
jgi:AraC-like DNA-binding protein